MGLDEDHIGDSRTLEFEAKFLAVTGGGGVDVVLNSLAGEFVDASLRLLPGGAGSSRWAKPTSVTPMSSPRPTPGWRYRAFDLFEAGAHRIAEMLAELVGLFDRGATARCRCGPWMCGARRRPTGS